MKYFFFFLQKFGYSDALEILLKNVELNLHLIQPIPPLKNTNFRPECVYANTSNDTQNPPKVITLKSVREECPDFI